MSGRGERPEKRRRRLVGGIHEIDPDFARRDGLRRAKGGNCREHLKARAPEMNDCRD